MLLFEDGRVRASTHNYCLDPMYMVMKVCHCIEDLCTKSTRKMHCVTMIDLYMVMVFVDAFENIVTQVTVNVYCCVTVTVTYSSWFALI